MIVEQLERDWNDKLWANTDLGCSDEIRTTLTTEAAIDLIIHEEAMMIREAEDIGLNGFDSSLVTDEFFGKTARSLTKIKAEQRSNTTPSYPFLVSCLSSQAISTHNLHSEVNYDFLMQYMLEVGLEVVSESSISLYLVCY